MIPQAEGPDRRALLKQALAAVEQMQAKLEASERSRHEPIAIVGVGCRLPGGVSAPRSDLKSAWYTGWR